MGRGGNGDHSGVDFSGKLGEGLVGSAAELSTSSGGALLIDVHHAREVCVGRCLENPQMMPAEGACANYCDSSLSQNLRYHQPVMWGRLVTCGRLLIGPFGEASQRQADYQSAADCQSAPHIVMPLAFAASSISSRSSNRVRPASTASAVVPVSFITSIVALPATGTSNNRCPRRLDTFTRRSGLPFTSEAARRSMASVPSIASTATHARSQIATLCPTSCPASAFAIRRP